MTAKQLLYVVIGAGLSALVTVLVLKYFGVDAAPVGGAVGGAMGAILGSRASKRRAE